MNTKIARRLDSIAGWIMLFAITFLLASPFMFYLSPVHADGGGWGDVFDSNGNLLPSVIDGGQVTQDAPWMPTIPGFGQIPATYHVYYTPSGSTVLLPSTMTTFFLAFAPGDQIGSPSSVFSTGAGVLTAMLGSALGGTFDAGGFVSALSGLTYTSPEQFADAMIAGQEDIWSLPPGDVTQMLVFLGGAAWGDFDGSLYLMALLYTPDNCAASPVGCPELPPTPEPGETPVPTPEPLVCPADSVAPGLITVNGQKTAPEYPLVVGQDPDQRGVDVSFSASVAPTIYTKWFKIPESECRPGADGNGNYNCTTDNGAQGHHVLVGWQCVSQVQVFDECIASAVASIALSQSSRAWILDELSIRYPGAYIHRPSFSVQGSGCSWTASETGLQVEDPGHWNMTVRGMTSGTPVSAPRNFSQNVGVFDAWLKEISIIK